MMQKNLILLYKLFFINTTLLRIQKILGETLIKILSIDFKIFKKNLFIGILNVFEVTPPEFKKIKHSVSFSYSIEK